LRESLKAKKQRIKRKIKTDEIDAIPLVDLLRVGNLDLNSGISAFSGGQATNKQKKILKIIKKFPLENSEKEKISVSNLLIRVNKTEILDNNNSNNNDNNYSKMNNIQKKNNKICSSFIDNKYINETTTNTTDNNEKNNNNNNNSNNNKDDYDNNANVNEAQYKEGNIFIIIIIFFFFIFSFLL
jgi:ATP-dependent Zn protease